MRVLRPFLVFVVLLACAAAQSALLPLALLLHGGTPITGLVTRALHCYFQSDAGAYTSSDTSTPCSTNGDAVQLWADQFNGVHNRQTTGGNRPTYQTNQINGLPIIRFNGTSSYFKRDVELVAPAWTMFCVLKMNSLANYNAISAGATNSFEWQIVQTTGVQGLVQTATAAIGGSATNIGTSAFKQINCSYNLTTGLYRCRLSSADDTDAGTNPNIKGALLETNLFGARYDVTSPYTEFLAADVAFFAIYGDALTLAEVQQVEAVLRSKYGVS